MGSVVILGACVATAPAAVYVDFEGGSADFDNAVPQTTGQFRRAASDVALSANGAANDHVRYTKTGGNGQTGVAVYDTTPGDGTTTRNVFLNDVVRTDFRIALANDSFGILLRLDSGSGNGYLAIANVNSNGTRDRLRLFDGSSTSTPGVVRSDLEPATSAMALNTWYTLEASAVTSGSDVILSAKIYAQGTFTSPLMQSTWTDTSATSPVTTAAGQIGLRFGRNNTSGTSLVDADNFAVPEPASLSAMLTASLLLRRRRCA